MFAIRIFFYCLLYLSNNKCITAKCFLFYIIVFGLFWIPGMCFVILGVSRPENPAYAKNATTLRLYQVGLYFVSLQPIASTLMAMTKTDVKNYTKKLLTLSYVFNKRNKTEEDDGE